MGVMALIGAAVFAGIRQYEHFESYQLLVPSGVLAFLGLLCFLGRFSLVLDVQAKHVKDSAGFWPFVRTRREWVSDFRGLEIAYGSESYTLWLRANDGRRISLGDCGTWPRLNDRAQELSQVTGWPVVDFTSGRSSLAALLRD